MAPRTLFVATAAATAFAVPSAVAQPTLVRDSLRGSQDVLDGRAIAALPGGDILVADAERGQILRFRADGSAAGGFGARGTALGQFASGPTDIALSPSGAIAYVADDERVQSFDVATGAPLSRSGVNGARFVAASRDGSTVYASGGTDCEVRRLDGTLAQSAIWSLPPCNANELYPGDPMEIGADGQGLVIGGPHAPVVRRIGFDGAVVSSLSYPSPGGFLRPNGLAIDSARGGFVLRLPGFSGASLARLTPSGDVAGYLGWRSGSGPPSLPDPVFGGNFPAEISDVTVASDGSLLTIERAGRIARVDDRPWLSRQAGSSRLDPVFTSQPVGLTALGSFASLAATARYDWDTDNDGGFEALDGGPDRSAVFRSAGTHRVRVRATGVDGSQGVGEITVNVSPNAPRATLAGPVVAVAGDRVLLDASGTTVPFGPVSGYEWDIGGDGRTDARSTSPTIRARLTKAGRRSITVTALSQDGLRGSATLRIEVRPAPPRGAPGVSIARGASATRRRLVTLRITWPRYARRMIVANDGGFARARPRPLSRSIRWRLKPGIGHRTVYVRFIGSPGQPAAYDPAPTLTYSDDINLLRPRRRR